MTIELISFEISLTTEQRIRQLKEREGLDDSGICNRAISTAQYVMQALQQRLRFFKEDQYLPMPRALQDSDPTFANFRLVIFSENLRAWDQICTLYNIDRHSVLVWGLNCVEILENTLVTHRVFIRGNRQEHPVRPKWLYK